MTNNELSESEKKELLKQFGRPPTRARRALRKISRGVSGRIKRELATRAERKRIFKQAFREEEKIALRIKARRVARRRVLGPRAFTEPRRVKRRKRRTAIRREARPFAFPKRFESRPLETSSGGFTLFPKPRKEERKKKRGRTIIIRM